VRYSGSIWTAALPTPVVTVVCAVAAVTKSDAAAAIIKSFFIGFSLAA